MAGVRAPVDARALDINGQGQPLGDGLALQRDQLTIFSGSLGKFVRNYEYVAQLMDFGDPDLEAFASFIADDAIFSPGPNTLRGKAAVLAAWSKYFEGEQAPFSWRPETVVVLDGGQLAQTKGPVFDPDGKAILEFRSTWRRDADGRWKVVFDDGTCLCGKRG